jgi:hypothetical protein
MDERDDRSAPFSASMVFHPVASIVACADHKQYAGMR